jgi:hypothetical protein
MKDADMTVEALVARDRPVVERIFRKRLGIVARFCDVEELVNFTFGEAYATWNPKRSSFWWWVVNRAHHHARTAFAHWRMDWNGRTAWKANDRGPAQPPHEAITHDEVCRAFRYASPGEARVMRSYLKHSGNGAEVARELGVSRQCVQQALAHVGKKVMDDLAG